ncbi:MAG: hypothetical protein JJ902_21145 [Roseibium sp.]|nr:hypothetical protein [Roseibium sp.]
MPRFLRTIRFDSSDTHVFLKAADPDEWAVAGSFLFMPRPGYDPALLTGKERQAFVSGFFGLGSFGASTLVSVGEIEEDGITACEAALIRFLVEDFGAPGQEAAAALAREEVAYARALAEDTALNTLLAIRREVGEDGAVREQFHIVNPPGERPHARIWDVVEDTE